MRTIINTYLVILFMILAILGAQQVPVPYVDQSRLVDWSNAGLYSDPSNEIANYLYINDFSGTNYQKITAAITEANNLSGTTLIYFPAGTYTIDQTVHITPASNGIIFMGDGSESTVLSFANPQDDDCFMIEGQPGTTAQWLSSIDKGEHGDFSGYSYSEWIHLWEEFEDNSGSPTKNYVGQIVQLSDDGVLEMKDAASKDYDAVVNNLWVTQITPVEKIGFQNLKIERTDDDKGVGKTIRFKYAVNCFVKGVESYMCTETHISIERSSHIEVGGCYIHSATSYNDDYLGGVKRGTGYGVGLAYSSTNCLIENNIFSTLRHAMIVGLGANRNVFAFNYSRHQKWQHYPLLGLTLHDGPDICLHGRYPYANLFESNSVERMQADDTHGNNGPYNTFLRNRANNILYLRLENSEFTNVVGNDITEVSGDDNNLADIISYKYDDPAPPFNVSEDDIPWTHGDWTFWCCPDIYHGFNFLNDVSYYYNSKPEFLDAAVTWPDIFFGPYFNLDLDMTTTSAIGTIPAKERWSDPVKTYLGSPSDFIVLANQTITTSESHEATSLIIAGPNFTVTSTGDVTFAAGNVITLKPGFTAVAGSDFRAYIDEGLGGSAPRLPTAIASVAEVDANMEEVQSLEDPIPTAYALSPAYPNPFNPNTTIRYALKEDVQATLRVYDLLGREVRVLVNEHQPAAYHSVVWDGRDRAGRPLPSGIYIARLVAGDFVAGIKMLLLK